MDVCLFFLFRGENTDAEAMQDKQLTWSNLTQRHEYQVSQIKLPNQIDRKTSDRKADRQMESVYKRIKNYGQANVKHIQDIMVGGDEGDRCLWGGGTNLALSPFWHQS